MGLVPVTNISWQGKKGRADIGPGEKYHRLYLPGRRDKICGQKNTGFVFCRGDAFFASSVRLAFFVFLNDGSLGQRVFQMVWHYQGRRQPAKDKIC